MDNKTFLEQARIKYQDKYSYDHLKYLDQKTAVVIVCKEHGHFKRKPAAFLKGYACSFCKKWKGEVEIKETLEKCKADFREQYDPRTDSTIAREEKKMMRSNRFYDFYIRIPKMTSKDVPNAPAEYKSYLVEFDGTPHFKYTPFFHKHEDKFLEQQQTDINKTKWALDNGYYLIRIDYTHLGKMAQTLAVAIASGKKLYLSTPSLYQYITKVLDGA